MTGKLQRDVLAIAPYFSVPGLQAYDYNVSVLNDHKVGRMGKIKAQM
jgi:hypothetical protein